MFESDGEKLLQLNTYGSEKRKIPGKLSQTLQLDRESAQELARVITDAFGAPPPAEPTPTGRVSLPPPDMRAHLNSLVGQEITTLTGAKNRVLRIEGDDVIVATSRSPSGQPVPLGDIQAAAERLYEQGSVEINPSSVGYRSAFVGAALASLPGAHATTDPLRVTTDTEH